MKIPISPRLLACAAFVRPDDRVADIGCDHGYLGIYLLRQGIAREVLCCDINEQPLQSAMRNARKFGTAQQMRFYLSDGLRNVPPAFDCLVCAGMGADTIISVLENAPWLQGGAYRLVLQCQTKTHILRRYLSDRHWCIRAEKVQRDGHFLYTVMEVCFDADTPPLSAGECYFSPALRASDSEDTAEYCRRMIKMLRNEVAARSGSALGARADALRELEALPQAKEEAI